MSGRADRGTGGAADGSTVAAVEHESAAHSEAFIDNRSDHLTDSPPDRLSDSPPDDRVNILLVDDQPANLLALEAMLQGLGQNIIKAESGREALKWLLSHDFAVILLDVKMPGGSNRADVIAACRRFDNQRR